MFGLSVCVGGGGGIYSLKEVVKKGVKRKLFGHMGLSLGGGWGVLGYV